MAAVTAQLKSNFRAVDMVKRLSLIILKTMALGLIWIYQHFVSPYMRHRCAYGIVHGGPGCSGFAKHALHTHGFWGALPEIRARLRACRAAARVLCPNYAHQMVHAQNGPDGYDNAPSTAVHPSHQAQGRRRKGCFGSGFDGCPYSCSDVWWWGVVAPPVVDAIVPPRAGNLAKRRQT